MIALAHHRANCMKQQIEIRSLAEAPSMGEDNRITGYAIVWGVESCVLADWEGEFVEIIERGAVDDALLATSDVKALFNHDHNALLARSTNGKGSLSLEIDDHGLKFSFEVPNTTLGNDVRELIKRGDLQGCSFAFYAKDEDCEFSRKPDGTRLRKVKKLALLADVSVVVDPAYTQTSVSARSFADSVEEKNPENEEKHLTVAAAKRFLRIMFN